MALSNTKIQNNLRDGLPYPYTEQDAADYISAMLSKDENEVIVFAVTVDSKMIGSINAGSWLERVLSYIKNGRM